MHALADCFDTSALTALQARIPRVLVVEDDPIFRAVFSAAVRALRPEVKILGAPSYEAARKVLDRESVGLVISVQMLAASGTGLNLWRHCKETGLALPFLLTSGLELLSMLDLMQEDESLPFFLPKPFAAKQCQRALSSLLGVNAL